MLFSATMADDIYVVEHDGDKMSPDRDGFSHMRESPNNVPALAGITPASRRNSRFCRQSARQDLFSSDNFGQSSLIRLSGMAYRGVGNPAIRRALSAMPVIGCHVPLTAPSAYEA
jgi:hypothetical protein